MWQYDMLYVVFFIFKLGCFEKGYKEGGMKYGICEGVYLVCRGQGVMVYWGGSVGGAVKRVGLEIISELIVQDLFV